MQKTQTVSATFVAIIAGIGMFLSTLDSGIINIAIPSLIEIFHTKLDVVVWTVSLYTLVLSATILFFGKLADRYGRLKIYKLGLIFFAVSSLLCGLSTNILILIVARGLQGLSAAMLQATAIAVITTKLEKEDLTKSIGILGMLMGLGPTLGPVLGGFILSSMSWRWIFWLNIPICLYGLYGCRQLKNTKAEILYQEPLNYFNLILFGTAMLLLLLGIDNIAENVTLALSIFIAMLVIFSLHIYIELKSTQPLINYALFKKITFSAPMISVVAIGCATAITFILPPLYFERLHQYAPWQVGLVSLSAPLGMAIGASIFGRFTKRFGTGIPMIIGMSLMTIALIILTLIQIDWSTGFIFVVLFIYGLGGGLFMTSNTIHLTTQFTMQKQAFISSLMRMILNAAIAFGAAASSMLISAKPNFLLHGIQHAWQLAAVFTTLALVSLIWMRVRKRSPLL